MIFENKKKINQIGAIHVFKKLWKKLPLELRNRCHFIFHRINSSRLLLRISSPRHYFTVKKLLTESPNCNIRLGESRRFEGWVSTNYQVFCRNFLNATQPYGNSIARFIFADNVIEHLNLREGTLIITNAFNALQPGGVLRLTSPNLEEIATRYLNQNSSDLEDFRYDLQVHGLDVSDFPDLLRVTFTEFGHEKGYIYDFATLKSILLSVGFINVERFRPGTSNKDWLKNLESRVGVSDKWSQMAVEATKPIK